VGYMDDRVWKETEIEALRASWGKLSVEQIARKLGRSENAVHVKAKRLKLGGIVDPSKFTKQDIGKLLRVRTITVGKWIEQRWLKASQAKTHHRPSGKILQIRPQDLLAFLQQHPDQWDATRAGDVRRECNRRDLLAESVKNRRLEGLEKRSVPEVLREPFLLFVVGVAKDARLSERRAADWIEKKRQQDKAGRMPREMLRWTAEEDARLCSLYRRNEHTLKQIGVVLGRSTNAIKHRLPKIDVWGVQERRAG